MTEDELPPTLVHQLLNLSPADRVGILFDAFGTPLGQELAVALAKADVESAALFVPLHLQRGLAKKRALPRILKHVIRWSSAFVVILSDDDLASPFRFSLVKALNKAGARVVHMPGVSKDLFLEATSGLDLSALRVRADWLLGIIGDAQELAIATYDSAGNPHHLQLHVRSNTWSHDLDAARPGRLAQIPCGELYVVPRERLTNGELVVRGAFPGFILNMEDEAVLRFSRGRLQLRRSTFSGSARGQLFRRAVEESRALRADNLVCEFGLGLNPGFVGVTGCSIRDQKVLGTAHITLGGNSALGGTSRAASRLAIAFEPGTVSADGEVIPMDTIAAAPEGL